MGVFGAVRRPVKTLALVLAAVLLVGFPLGLGYLPWGTQAGGVEVEWTDPPSGRPLLVTRFRRGNFVIFRLSAPVDPGRLRLSSTRPMTLTPHVAGRTLFVELPFPRPPGAYSVTVSSPELRERTVTVMLPDESAGGSPDGATGNTRNAPVPPPGTASAQPTFTAYLADDPRVVFPGERAAAGYNVHRGTIRVVMDFSRPMDRDSVEAAVIRQLGWGVATEFAWNDDGRSVLVTAEPLKTFDFYEDVAFNPVGAVDEEGAAIQGSRWSGGLVLRLYEPGSVVEVGFRPSGRVLHPVGRWPLRPGFRPLAASPDDTCLLAREDGTGILWLLVPGEGWRDLSAHVPRAADHPYPDHAFWLDADRLLINNYGATAVYHVSEDLARPWAELPGDIRRLSVALSPDGCRVACLETGADGRPVFDLVLRDLEGGVVRRFPGVANGWRAEWGWDLRVPDVDWLPDGSGVVLPESLCILASEGSAPAPDGSGSAPDGSMPTPEGLAPAPEESALPPEGPFSIPEGFTGFLPVPEGYSPCPVFGLVYLDLDTGRAQRIDPVWPAALLLGFPDYHTVFVSPDGRLVAGVRHGVTEVWRARAPALAGEAGSPENVSSPKSQSPLDLVIPDAGPTREGWELLAVIEDAEAFGWSHAVGQHGVDQDGQEGGCELYLWTESPAGVRVTVPSPGARAVTNPHPAGTPPLRRGSCWG